MRGSTSSGTPMAATDSNLITDVLGPDFSIERELRGGGLARVVVARDHSLGRRIVVKILPPGTLSPEGVDRFRREIQVALELQHPHIVPILAAGLSGDRPYLVMPFIDGGSLRDRLASGPLGVVEAVGVLRGVAQALAYAHARGVVHRDIKPDNVLLSGGSPAVADFGIAKAIARTRDPARPDDRTLTTAGTSLGTPAYMAPEQIAADPGIDHRADIYGFGVMAYEMLAGAPPFAGDSVQRLFAAHLSELPEPLHHRRANVPLPLTDLVMECLEKEPLNRPQSAQELATALDHPDMISGTFATGAATVRTPRRTTAPARAKRRTRWVFGTGIALALAALIAIALVRGFQTTGAPSAPPLIAVLPLSFIGADSAQRFVADGVGDAVASALAGEPGVRALSRTRAATLQRQLAKGDSPRGLTDVYLEGAVMLNGGPATVALRLVDAASGVMVWGGTVSAPADSLSTLYPRAAAAVVAAVRAHHDSGASAKQAGR